MSNWNWKIELKIIAKAALITLILVLIVWFHPGCVITKGIEKRLDQTNEAVSTVVSYMAIAAPEKEEEALEVFYRQFTLKNFGKVRAEAWTVYVKDGVLFADDGFKIEGHFTIYEGRPFAWVIPDGDD